MSLAGCVTPRPQGARSACREARCDSWGPGAGVRTERRRQRQRHWRICQATARRALQCDPPRPTRGDRLASSAAQRSVHGTRFAVECDAATIRLDRRRAAGRSHSISSSGRKTGPPATGGPRAAQESAAARKSAAPQRARAASWAGEVTTPLRALQKAPSRQPPAAQLQHDRSSPCVRRPRRALPGTLAPVCALRPVGGAAPFTPPGPDPPPKPTPLPRRRFAICQQPTACASHFFAARSRYPRRRPLCPCSHAGATARPRFPVRGWPESAAGAVHWPEYR